MTMLQKDSMQHLFSVKKGLRFIKKMIKSKKMDVPTGDRRRGRRGGFARCTRTGFRSRLCRCDGGQAAHQTATEEK